MKAFLYGKKEERIVAMAIYW
ncbi:hypothetical protein BB14905_13440 [Bacillus sp. B14905]|nr:hypothetical protein BB14905_13440 [Bacillus sp. B14905]